MSRRWGWVLYQLRRPLLLIPRRLPPSWRALPPRPRVRLIAVGATFALALGLSGYRATKRSLPSPSPSSSVAALIRPDPTAREEPEGERVLRRHGTLLADPIPTCDSQSWAELCKPTFFAFYGDPATRHIDAVWSYTPDDRSASERVERPIQGPLRPIPNFPVGARLLAARLDDDGSSVLALVESEAVGSQPAGLRGVVQLNSGTISNGPWGIGLVPSPGLSASEDLARLAAMRPTNPLPSELFAGGQATDPPTKHPPPSATLEEVVEPEGLILDEIWQDAFRREVERLPSAALRQWPRREELRQALWSADGFECARWTRLYNSRTRCFLPFRPYSSVSFGGTKEHSTIRALSREHTIDEGRPRDRKVGPRAVVPSGGAREALEAYLARQPLTGRLVASAPLRSRGGTVGFFMPAPGSAHGPLLALVDGPLGAIFEPWSQILLNPGASLPDASRVEVRFLDLEGKGETSLLVWIERPGRPPWASVVVPSHPLESTRAPGVFEELGPWINRAASLDEAVAQALRAPDVKISWKEVRGLLAAARTREGFQRHSLPDSVVFTFRGEDPFDQRSAFTPRAEVTDADLDWLPGQDAEGSCTFMSGSGGYFTCDAHEGSQPLHHIWITREAGQPTIVALARQTE